VGKRDDNLERQSLVFIQYSNNYSGITKETERKLGPPQRWLWSLREIPSTRRNLWEEFPKVSEALAKPQSQSELSRVKETWTDFKNLRECSDFLKDDSEDFREIPSAWRNLWEGFLKVTKVSAKLQSHPESSWGSLEHCLPVMVTEFKLSEATLARALVAPHSIRRLLFPFVTFQNSTMNVYMLACIYYVFLEIVRIWLFNNYPESAWFSAGRLDRCKIPNMAKLRYLMLDHDWTRVQCDWAVFSRLSFK
jgi:hypothetical protein